MSKSANAGELRTRAYFLEIRRETDSDGYPVERKENVFGEGTAVFVKWVNAHGAESFTAMQLSLREPATLTMRYSPKITPQLVLYREDDPEPFEIISMDDVENRHCFLEVKVQRKVGAR